MRRRSDPPRGPWWGALVIFPAVGFILWPVMNAIGFLDNGSFWRSAATGVVWGLFTGALWTWWFRKQLSGDT